MFMQIVSAISGLFVALLVFDILKTIFVNQLIVAKLRKNGIPIADRFGLLGGHIDITQDGDNWKFLADQHKKHGHTYGYLHPRREFIITKDLDLIKTMIFDNPQHINRTNGLDVPVAELEKDSLIFSQNDTWRRLRKAMAPAFAVHRFKTPTVQEEINNSVSKFLASIEKRLDIAANEKKQDFIVINVEDLCHRFSLDVVFSCFYKQPDAIDFDADKDWWQSYIEEFLRGFRNPLLKLAFYMPSLQPLSRIIIAYHPQATGLMKVRSYIKQQTVKSLEARKAVKDATQRGEKVDPDNVLLKDGSRYRRNMIDYIIDQFHDKKMTANEYMASSGFLFQASNKTSSDALAKLIYVVAVYPEVQSKLRESILKDGIASEYLSWCLDETMRLYPPTMVGCSRVTDRDIKTSDGKMTIPKGCYVFVSNCTIQRLPEYWGPDADEFRPERFAESLRKNFHPIQFIPFGAGSRRCLAADFALFEIKQIMTALMKRYKFEYLPGDKPLAMKTPFFLFNIYDEPTNIKFTRL